MCVNIIIITTNIMTNTTSNDSTTITNNNDKYLYYIIYCQIQLLGSVLCNYLGWIQKKRAQPMVPLVCCIMGVEMCECSAALCFACHGSQTRGWPAHPCQWSNGTRGGVGMPKPLETGLLTSANKRKAGGRDSSMLLCFRENLPWHRLSAPGTMKVWLMGLLTVHWTQPSSYRHQGSGREGDHRWSNENEIEVHYVSPLTCLWLSSRVLHSLLCQDIHQKCFASNLTISNIERLKQHIIIQIIIDQ